jgi:hypothetical protein
MIWTIALIGGIYSTSVSYLGQYTEEAACVKAATELKAQGTKVVCVQIQPTKK